MSTESEEREREHKRQKIAEAKASMHPQTIRDDAEARQKAAAANLGPLKHYVRREGWESVISSFLEKQKACGVARPWKYLTLPGIDALDIGHFYRKKLLGVTAEGRLSVAICDKDEADRVALLLQKFGGVLASTKLELQDALRDPSNPIVKEFPFDVINLDFCNSLIRPNRNNLEALDQVFSLQRGQGFLLLLTSRPALDQKIQHQQLKIVADNLQIEQEFQESYIARYGSSDPQACLADYTNFTQLVFSKLVAKYAKIFGYRVYERFTARYHKSGGGPDGFDMITHSFELDPIVGKKPCRAKYEPRLPHARIEQVLHEVLAKRIEQETNSEYTRFIRGLPQREALNINEVLNAQQDLVSDLTKEAESLSQWMI